ncbi:MAG: outer membrane lipoprotein-sorting protein [Opitutae bacterium]|nr:outer membrane lipoprotein-sorting protein [Opitutae bacterium]
MDDWKRAFLSGWVRALSRWSVMAVMGLLPSLAAGGAEVPDPTPRQMLDRVDNLHRGSSSHGVMAMKVVRENWSRELKLEFWTQGKDNTLVRILEPAKEKGTATLRTEGKIWNYLPKVSQVIKIPASMMGSSWMGSHFSNDDLVKQNRLADDYEFVQTFTGERDGAPVAEITCTPKAYAAVVWGRVVVTVSRADWLPRRLAYFDEDLRPVRTLTFADFRPLGDLSIPRVARMVPEDPAQEMTEIRYEDLSFNVALPADWFSIRELQR